MLLKLNLLLFCQSLENREDKIGNTLIKKYGITFTSGTFKNKRLPVSDWPFRFLVGQTIEVDVWLVVNELWM